MNKEFTKFCYNVQGYGSRAVAYTLKSLSFISGSLESMTGAIIIPLALSNAIQADSIENLASSLTAFSVSTLFLADGLYTLKKQERPHDLLFTGIEKLTNSLGEDKSVFPKFSECIKYSEKALLEARAIESH
ncbi:MAG: hypothetical protein Q7R87_02965 [Nanoarchaeota archaeon]|nr:hypothetical protein [Nanoarchaeota archaeon]